MTSFIYIRQADRTPVGCISYQPVTDESGTNKVKFSYSLCAKSDMKKFTKALSRKISEERMKDEELVFVVDVDSQNRHEVVRKILTHVSGAQVPQKIKNFGRDWLKNHPQTK